MYINDFPFSLSVLLLHDYISTRVIDYVDCNIKFVIRETGDRRVVKFGIISCFLIIADLKSTVGSEKERCPIYLNHPSKPLVPHQPYPHHQARPLDQPQANLLDQP